MCQSWHSGAWALVEVDSRCATLIRVKRLRLDVDYDASRADAEAHTDDEDALTHCGIITREKPKQNKTRGSRLNLVTAVEEPICFVRLDQRPNSQLATTDHDTTTAQLIHCRLFGVFSSQKRNVVNCKQHSAWS